MTFVAGALGILFAYLIPLIGENVVAAYLTVVGIFDMPFFVIAILFGLLWKRANWQGALIGYLAGIIAGAISAVVSGVDAFFTSTFISTGTVIVVTWLASYLFPPQPEEQLRPIWRAKSHNIEDEGEAYHIIPISGWGKFFFTLFFVGMGMFLAGVLSGAVAFAYAGTLALLGMILYFVSGLLRLMFD